MSYSFRRTILVSVEKNPGTSDNAKDGYTYSIIISVMSIQVAQQHVAIAIHTSERISFSGFFTML